MHLSTKLGQGFIIPIFFHAPGLAAGLVYESPYCLCVRLLVGESDSQRAREADTIIVTSIVSSDTSDIYREPRMFSRKHEAWRNRS